MGGTLNAVPAAHDAAGSFVPRPWRPDKALAAAGMPGRRLGAPARPRPAARAQTGAVSQNWKSMAPRLPQNIVNDPQASQRRPRKHSSIMRPRMSTRTVQ